MVDQYASITIEARIRDIGTDNIDKITDILKFIKKYDFKELTNEKKELEYFIECDPCALLRVYPFGGNITFCNPQNDDLNYKVLDAGDNYTRLSFKQAETKGFKRIKKEISVILYHKPKKQLLEEKTKEEIKRTREEIIKTRAEHDPEEGIDDRTGV